MSKLYSPPEISPGSKIISFEPRAAPCIFASVIFARSWHTPRCCAFSPPDSLPARMLYILTFSFLTQATDRAVLSPWPPPSPALPSISSMAGYSQATYFIAALSFQLFSKDQASLRQGAGQEARQAGKCQAAFCFLWVQGRLLERIGRHPDVWQAHRRFRLDRKSVVL